MFKIIMIIAVVVLAIGWAAYAIWELKMRAEEKKQPRQVSKGLQDARSEMADYAKKLASFKKPTPRQQPKEDDADG
ncbi:MAG: hypothetical protein JSU70_20725 [Phycisphaerales bacterium]|nr:MAG: hypothetical protein JSU70_20725 [Phycisphaerales bacterium]